ncbi:hypothetical protein [Streptomyces sp. NPDC093060]|uniref:hypothetical protein n=1 Tax=Streptomyces sp. NPDC093060 TaxID=3366019 RepID=UPI003827DDDA
MDDLDSSFREGRGADVIAALTTAFADVEARDLHARWHPLGFFRIELPAVGDGHRYVVHAWPRGERLGERSPWPVHSHAWMVESCVVSGRMRDLQYRRATSGEALKGPLYQASNVGETSRLERTSALIGLDVDQEVITEAGQFYSIGMHVFHRSVVEIENHCITVARLGRRTGAKAYVLGDCDGPAERTSRTGWVGLGTLTEFLGDLRESDM